MNILPRCWFTMAPYEEVVPQMLLVLVTLACFTHTVVISTQRISLPNLLGSEHQHNYVKSRILKKGKGFENILLLSKQSGILDGTALRVNAVSNVSRDQVKNANISGRQSNIVHVLSRIRREESDEDESNTDGKYNIFDENPFVNVDAFENPLSAIAKAVSQYGKTVATALSNTGNVVAEAINGTIAKAVAYSNSADGNANATADTNGEGVSKAISMAKENGSSTSWATSRGTGNSEAAAVAIGGGNALSQSLALRGGNSTSSTASTSEGVSSSSSTALNGSSSAMALSEAGNSSADSFAGALNGTSSAAASSKGGNVLANSVASEGGSSRATGITTGAGNAVSNAISKNGETKAETIAVDGVSIANATDIDEEFPQLQEEEMLEELESSD